MMIDLAVATLVFTSGLFIGLSLTTLGRTSRQEREIKRLTQSRSDWQNRCAGWSKDCGELHDRILLHQSIVEEARDLEAWASGSPAYKNTLSPNAIEHVDAICEAVRALNKKEIKCGVRPTAI